MVIGIDIRALQTGHKYRGIGEVAKQITNHILQFSAAEAQPHSFIFFEYDDPGNDPKELLTIPANTSYSVQKLGPMPEKDTRGKKAKLKQVFKNLYGNPITGAHKCDAFLQFDYAFGMPRKNGYLISNDFIPWIFYKEYFESAWVPFKNKAARTTLKTIFHNYRSKRIMVRSHQRAKKILAISTNTKHDVTRFTGVKQKKIEVALLGADQNQSKTVAKKLPKQMPTKPYLLFVGAGDERRRVDDLVSAYNNLKAAGHDVQLALVGENFVDKDRIPNATTKKAVCESSYNDDILMMGYVSDATKHQLYKNAIAFVYPTLYEGFGIPVIESMIHGCPVITYPNSSLPEVGGTAALYAKDWWGIKVQVEKLIAMNNKGRNTFIEKARKHASMFTWEGSASKVYAILNKK